MSSPTLSQKFTAEAIGTAILVFIGAGSVPLTGLPDRATGHRISAPPSLSTISFAFAFAIFAAVYSVGHISGCHINPAVTIALLATRKIDGRTAGGYIVRPARRRRSSAPVLTLIILTGNDPAKLGLGAVSVNANAGIAVGFAAEVIGTAILVFTVFGAAVDGQAPGGLRRDHHRVHRLRDHHPGRPDHRRRPQPGPRARAGHPRPGHRRPGASRSISSSSSTSSAPTIGGVVGAFLYEFIGARAPAGPTPPGRAGAGDLIRRPADPTSTTSQGGSMATNAPAA